MICERDGIVRAVLKEGNCKNLIDLLNIETNWSYIRDIETCVLLGTDHGIYAFTDEESDQTMFQPWSVPHYSMARLLENIPFTTTEEELHEGGFEYV